MFFVLSKTLNYLTMPLVIICIALALSLIIKSTKWKRGFRLTGIGLLFFFSNEFIANEAAKQWEVPVTPFADMNQKYEWAILLTGVTRTQVGPEDRVYFSRGADRVTHTLQLYKMGYVKKILISGGEGTLIKRGRKEADALKDALLLMGVPETDIVTESISRNTYESAEEVQKIFKEKNITSTPLLVTSAFHMRRSLACFQKVGIQAVPFSTDFLTHERKFTPDVTLVPRVEAIGVWHSLVKEWVGMTAYWLTGHI